MKVSGRSLVQALLVAVWLGPVATARPAAAQVTRDTVTARAAPDTVAADTTPPLPRRISPRGAMLRSVTLPGWGQAAVGSHTRGGVFFTVAGTSWYMLLRTLGRLGQIRQVEDRLVGLATDSLNQLIAMDTAAARRLSDPLRFDAAVDSFPGLATARGLVDARRQQRQDWITYTLFLTLMSGVDAYVNAHLKDFPTSIATEARRDGSFAVTVRVPWSWSGGPPRPVPASAAASASRRR